MGTCVYCGEWRELTRDHVPPKSLFSKPRPELITVPSCLTCNQGASKDDEYFRLMIVQGINREKFPQENSDSINAINKLSQPERLSFAHYLLGRYRPDIGGFTVDRHRIGAVLYRIAKGLYYHHTGKRLADDACFHFKPVGKDECNSDAGIQFLVQRQLVIGDGKFRYCFIDNGAAGTVWLMSFFDHHDFFCSTGER
jgi:hypothetical protein